MLRKVLLVLALAAGVAVAVVLLTRGGKAPTPTTTPTTTSARTMAVETYFFRGAALVPVTQRVPQTSAVATAALRALLAGPPPGLRTTVPSGTTLAGITTTGGKATADFSAALAKAPRTTQAQIVYTLTQFPTVREVVIEAAASPLELADGSGRTLLRAATRADYVDLTPTAPIFVESPLRDATVKSPVSVSGTASVFEATFMLEIQSGFRRHTITVTASAGAPERGTWSVGLGLPPGPYRLRLYEPSAENGKPLHETTVDFTVRK